MRQPMLATHAPEDLEKLSYPLYASAKLDGVRAVVKDGKVLSRSMKPIPNLFIQRALREFDGLDGELTVGLPTASNLMQTTMSAVMSFDGEPDFTFRVFDHWNRLFSYSAWVSFKNNLRLPPRAVFHEQHFISSAKELAQYEQDIVTQGYEGVITRSLDSGYKFGRSTARQEWLLKIKRFAQDEAVIVGTEPLMRNWNHAEFDERGYTKRSSCQDFKHPDDLLGALVCEKDGIQFRIGTGFDTDTRHYLWSVRDSLPGKLVSFKHFAQTGVKTAPRHPVFCAIRSTLDL